MVKWIRTFCLLTISLIPFISRAQTYGNEWIDYSKTYYKIKVTKDGLHRIPYATLTTAQGLNLSAVNGSDFNLYHNGEVVPIYVTNNGLLTSGDYIEFYGEKNTGWLDTRLYADPEWQMNPYFSLFNDTAVYYLTWSTSDPNILINNITNDLSNPPAKENSCTITTRQWYNSEFNYGEPYYLAGSPLQRCIFDAGEGFVHTNFTKSSQKNYTLSTPFPYSSGSAQLKTVVLSRSNTQHRVIITLNNNTTLKDTAFTGYLLNKFNFNLSASSLNASNNLNFTAAGSGSTDNNAVSLLELTYPSQFNFNNQSKQAFSISGTVGQKYLEIDNFDQKGTNPILYDFTNNMRIEGSQGTPVKFKLPSYPSSAERKLYLSSQDAADITTVSILTRINFKNYNNPTFQGSYVIVSNASLFNDGNGNNRVAEYAQYRASLNGGGYTTTIVEVDELYDQFAYGVRKHPLAIRNFMHYAQDAWIIKPAYLLLIGKAREYQEMRTSSSAYQQCTVPTYGNPGSDNQLAATNNSIAPAVPAGRLSVVTGDQIRKYLNKVKDFETEQRKTGDPYQTIANKLWMKQALHLGGGESSSEQTAFKFYLDSYEDILEDTLYGGNVNSFFKTSSDPIQIAQSEHLSTLINSGVSLITFFGHSSPSSFDISIDNPNNYENYQRYHLILSNGCYTGDIFNASAGISEDFVLAEDKGAIGFISSISLSASTALNVYSTNIYKKLSVENYDESIGTIMQQTMAEVEQCCSTPFNLMIAEEMTLNGDPALKINTHKEPDYALEPQMISFNPPVVSVEQDSFTINIIVTNLGKAINDSIDLEVSRDFPDGSGVTYVKRIKATTYSDTIPMVIQTGANSAFGLNNFRIKIDAADEVLNELSETNNYLGIPLNILSEDVFPIYPYEFSIVPEQGVTLKASTANAFAGEKAYIMQIDTTELFNSPLKQSTTIVQGGGVLKWTPSITYMDSTVYYWRVGLDTTQYGSSYPWHYSSFIYLAGSSPGWNQSHYYQYLKDRYDNTYMDSDRRLKFIDDLKQVSVTTGTSNLLFGGPLPWDQISYYLNNTRKHKWDCGNQGFNGGITFAVFDSVSGENWLSYYSDVVVDPFSGYNISGVHKSIHCKNRDLEAFPFPTTNSTWQQRIVDFINSIPDGNYILAYSVNNARYGSWSQDLKDAFMALGATQPYVLADYSPWAFFAKKGDPGTATEDFGTSFYDILNFSATFEAKWYQGEVTSPLIGPAFKWSSLHWRNFAEENPTYDETDLQIIGVKYDGTETVITQDVNSPDTSLQYINAATYPYIKLRLDTRDDTMRTPTQLRYWRINYDKVPEAALNAHASFSFNRDTLALGEKLNVSVALENVTEIDMDSMLVKYSLFNSSNQLIDTYTRYDSLRAFQTMNANFDFNTGCNCLSPVNSLVIEANPNGDQPEQFHFNNIGILSFKLVGDYVNPLLDVTFDGTHIMDGDIVSAEPDILIKLKDENKYLALDDTSLINVYIQHPDGQLERMMYDNTVMQFFPATPGQNGGNNTAEILLTKQFQKNGKYQLLVQAQDKSRNASGNYGDRSDDIDYRIEFEVIREARITNVLNYPNPFTTSTRFVFTLTGIQPPTYMKIQILTISGKVVREITMGELGPIRIGNNLTEFAWDGTDQYGAPLANGLYLYRVVASIDGKAIDHMETSADKYFKAGFGKMYLAR